MKVHADEFELAHAYQRRHEFEELNAEQMRAILDRGRVLFLWFKAHPWVHNFINAAVILSLFLADALTMLVLPRPLLGDAPSAARILLASAIVGIVHSWIGYSMSIFSLHEGAAHNLAFAGSGPLAKAGQFVGTNLCRLAYGEPDNYAACHSAHHARFGTEYDSEFLNFVKPRRLWLTLLPLAVVINFTDFLIHRPLTYTRSRVISGLVTMTYNGVYGYFVFKFFGLAFALLTLLVFVPHVGFYLDRFRQFTEHNLMPLENRNGARSFGVGFWGLLIGGGPWGQPCHWAHHLVPSIPWYQQILLHIHIRALLTPRQREQFLIAPFVGFPRMLWRIVRDANAFARNVQFSNGAPEPSVHRESQSGQ